jgi:hypothetical protein
MNRYILIVSIIFGFISCNNAQNNRLPEEYKDYKSLDSIKIKDTIQFGNHYLKLLFKSFDQAPAKDGAYEGRYRKREIHNG